jgi:MFS family permease
MTSTPATALRPVTGRLWRHRDFRRLWAAQTVSRFGSMVSELALPLTAILVLHASTLQVGMLTAVESVAFLLVGLRAGAWVDRMRTRQVLIVTDVLRAIVTSTAIINLFTPSASRCTCCYWPGSCTSRPR